jgi:hypothetical protein
MRNRDAYDAGLSTSGPSHHEQRGVLARAVPPPDAVEATETGCISGRPVRMRTVKWSGRASQEGSGADLARLRLVEQPGSIAANQVDATIPNAAIHRRRDMMPATKLGIY